MENISGQIGSSLQRETSVTSSYLEDQNERGTRPRGSSSSTSSGQGSGSGTESKSGGRGSDGGSSSGHGFGEIYSQNERAYFEDGGISPTLRSLSLASISSEGSIESHLVDQEDIVALSASVRAFKEALGRLRKIFGQGREKNEVSRVVAHERLGEVLKILRNILENYSAIQHTELLSAASKLITHVNGFQYDTEEYDSSEFLEAIDNLALAFSTRMSDYLMGDIDTPTTILKCCSSTASSKTKSCENLLCSDDESESDVTFSNSLSLGLQEMSSNNSNISSIDKEFEVAPIEEVDEILQQHEKGVELALHQAKIWSKYSNDLLIYVLKRCQITIDFAKKQAKLASAIKPILKEENFMSFQDIMYSSVEQEIEFSKKLSSTFLLIQSSKFIEPLTVQRIEHEKSRKALKDLWHRQLKKLTESVNSLKRAKLAYIQRSQEALKFGETLQKNTSEELPENLEKKREDFSFKVCEAAGIYSAAVKEANDQHTALQFVKKEILKSIKELLLQADIIMKQVISTYFQMQQSLADSLSFQLQTHLDLAKRYEPGTEYVELVRRFLPVVSDEANLAMNPFEFEYFSATGSNLLPSSEYFNTLSFQSGSDTDSITSSRSGKSTEVSPTSSPHSGIRRFAITISSGDELEGDMDGDMSFSSEIQVLSKAADTHSFRKLKTPSRCRECDSYVYFHGFECAECGLGCHKKCLETLAIQCGHKRLPRKLTTFGVDLQQHLQETNAQIPHLVTKCLNEIDARGTTVKGIYRVSGLKSRVEKLCQAFENGSHLVDLTNQQPNVIANVLKLYLRQLPEPLLTFHLYSDFIRIAKDSSVNYSYETSTTINQIKELVKRLPPHHLLCLGALMLHLNRIAAQAEINNMPPSNLGIVFGPTLLRTSEGSASLNSLVDTMHQTKVIELLIIHAKDIFCSDEALLRKLVQQSSFLYNQHHQQQQDQMQQPHHQITLQTNLCDSKETHDAKSVHYQTFTSLLATSESSSSSAGFKGSNLEETEFKSSPMSRQNLAHTFNNNENTWLILDKTLASSDELSGEILEDLSVPRNIRNRSEDEDKDTTIEITSETLIPFQEEHLTHKIQKNPYWQPTKGLKECNEEDCEVKQDAGKSSIIKTSLKDYVGLEMASLQETRTSSLEISTDQKLKESFVGNLAIKLPSNNYFSTTHPSMKDILSSNYETFIDAEKSCESEDPETNSKQFQNLSLPIWDETPTFKLQTNQLQEQQEITVQSQKQSQQHQSFPCCQKIELSKHAPLSHTYRQENQQMQQNENLSQHFQRKCPIQTFQQESEMKICQQKLPLPQQASLRKNPTNNDDHTYETLGSDAPTKKNQTQGLEHLEGNEQQQQQQQQVYYKQRQVFISSQKNCDKSTSLKLFEKDESNQNICRYNNLPQTPVSEIKKHPQEVPFKEFTHQQGKLELKQQQQFYFCKHGGKSSFKSTDDSQETSKKNLKLEEESLNLHEITQNIPSPVTLNTSTPLKSFKVFPDLKTDSEVLRPSPDQNISVENLKPIELSSFQNEDEGFQTNSLPSTPKSNKIRISSTQKNRHGSINQKYTSFSKPEKLITEERDEFLSLSAAEIYEISKNSNRKVENQVIITVPTINKGVDKINLKSIESEEFLKDFTYSDSSAESHKNISGSSSDTQN